MKKSRVLIGVGMTFAFIMIANTKASAANFTVYTNNCPGIQDWKHEFISTGSNTYLGENLTGWIKKDSSNPITIQYTESVTGTFTYSQSVDSSISVGAELMGLAIERTNSLNTSLSYSYSKTQMRSYTWIISPSENGEYFCIAINVHTDGYDVDHYKQKFKLFGQGKYEYQCSSHIEVPDESYMAKNYRYYIDGIIYEK